MIAYNVVLKLKGYIKLSEMDFKSTVEELKDIYSTRVELTRKVTATYIPAVNERLEKLFNIMGFKMPKRVDY
jgi:Lhr-like helicase